jgi:hypothetical protein
VPLSPGEGCLEVAIFGDTFDRSLRHIQRLKEKLFAAIPFKFELKVEPEIRCWGKNETQDKLILEMAIIPNIPMKQAISCLMLEGFMRKGRLPGKLYQGMYSDASNPVTNLFGLQSGQTRETRLAHNGGWYNKSGKKLGWGDISPKDFRRIAREIIRGEFFFITPEEFSSEESPGLDYVLDHVIFATAAGQFYHIVDSQPAKDGMKQKIKGIDFAVISRRDFKKGIDEWPTQLFI